MDERQGVTLRPATEADLEVWDRLLADPAVLGEHQWLGFRDPFLHRRRWDEDRFLRKSPYRLVVDVAGEAAGSVTWFARDRPSEFADPC